jgi:hypothetical protein
MVVVDHPADPLEDPDLAEMSIFMETKQSSFDIHNVCKIF